MSGVSRHEVPAVQQPAVAQEAVASVRDLLPQEVISAISAVAVIASKESPHPVQKHIDTINSWLYAAPAPAAQEAVATVESFTSGSYHRNYKLRWHKNVDAGTQLFAAPVTAAPVTVTRDADGEIVMVKHGDTIIASTCHAGGKAHAAPEIDHRSLIEKWRNSGNPDYGDCADDIEALIDASPEGDEAQQAAAQAMAIVHTDGFHWNGQHWQKDSPMAGSKPQQPEVVESAALIRALADYPSRNTHQLQARKVCAGVLTLAMSYGSEAQNSPKGSSEALDAARYRFLRDVAHPDSDDGIAVTIQKQDSWGNWRDMHLHGPELDAGTDAAMQAQSGDAEVQP